MLRTTILVMFVLQSMNALAAEYDPWTAELERVIEKRLGYFHRAPCGSSQGFLVYADTRCRANLPLTDEDRERGALTRVIVNLELVCRKPVGDVQADHMYTYEEQPQGLWRPVATNDQDRELLRRTCR